VPETLRRRDDAGADASACPAGARLVRCGPCEVTWCEPRGGEPPFWCPNCRWPIGMLEIEVDNERE
jgi:hypothetical protein